MFSDQSEFDIRCEWGAAGIRSIGRSADVIVIVDALSFSTCVDIGVSRGAIVFPCRWGADDAQAYARLRNAELAVPRGQEGRYSLSPISMQNAARGTRVVLPSPNGSELTTQAAELEKHLLTSCFRNCKAIANYTSTLGRTIAVIPAGERWPDGTLRPAIEDFAAAGALIANLSGRLSPEASAAIGVWDVFKNELKTYLANCASGRELIQKGFEEDVQIAAEIDVSTTVPLYHESAYACAGNGRIAGIP
jgi:2-phosphosulfolactate phosphatase